MIQRIQTVLLLLALILTGSLFFIDLAQLATAESSFTLTVKGVIEAGNIENPATILPAQALKLLMITSVGALVASIFIYKRRILQIRICGLSLGFLIGLPVLTYFFGKSAARELEAAISFNWPVTFPLIAVVLVILAIRAIGKDEAMVRGLNRIR